MRARPLIVAGVAAALLFAGCGDSGAKSNRITFWCGEIDAYLAANSAVLTPATAADPTAWKKAFVKVVSAASDAAGDAPTEARAAMTQLKDFYTKWQAIAAKDGYVLNTVSFDPDFSTLRNDPALKSASDVLNQAIRSNCPSSTTVPAATTVAGTTETTVVGATATTAASASTT